MRTKIGCRSLLAASLLASLMAAPAAHAVHVCSENNQIRFSPPLQLTDHVGTATLSWQYTCPYSDDGVTYGTGSLSFPYSGSCVAVTSAEPWVVMEIVGGTLYVETYRTLPPAERAWLKVQALRPDQPCPITSVSGTGFEFVQR